jgi:hypothetical protein
MMARGELHIQLNVDYADDEKLADVSRSARLLYVDALCKAKRMLNDGILTPAQVEKLGYPERPPAVKKAAGELVANGAWRWDEDRKVYVIAAWLKRNKSRAQIEEDRAVAEEASLRANHKRWHVDRKDPDARCRLCKEESTSGSGRGSGKGSGRGSQRGQRSDSTETETETETETRSTGGTLPPDPLRPSAPTSSGHSTGTAGEISEMGHPLPQPYSATTDRAHGNEAS